MGMFDTVVIENLKSIKLPKEIVSYIKISNASIPSDYQTKDLENSLSTYKIDKNNNLWREERIPTGKKKPFEPFSFSNKRESFVEKLYHKIYNKTLYPSLRMVDEFKYVLKKQNLTQTFLIYTYEEIGGKYVEIELEITVIKGKVEKIKHIKSSIESDKEAKNRRERDEEFKQEIASSEAFYDKLHSSWYYPIIREIYNPLAFFSQKILHSLGNSLVRISFKLRRF